MSEEHKRVVINVQELLGSVTDLTAFLWRELARFCNEVRPVRTHEVVAAMRLLRNMRFEGEPAVMRADMQALEKAIDALTAEPSAVAERGGA